MKKKQPEPPAWATEANDRIAQFEAMMMEAEAHLVQTLAIVPGTPPTRILENITEPRARVTKWLREHVEETARPKGLIATVEKRERDKVALTLDEEVERVTPSQIIMRNGSRYRRDSGLEVRKRYYGEAEFTISAASLAAIEAHYGKAK